MSIHMYLTQKNPHIVTNNTNFPTYSDPQYSKMTLFQQQKIYEKDIAKGIGRNCF